jgi:hypothetical protein
MRIDRKKLTLIIASLCGTGSSAIALGQDYSDLVPASSVGRIGDGGVSANGDDDYADASETSQPVAYRSNVIGDSGAADSSGSHYVSHATPTYSSSCGTSPCATSCGSVGGGRGASIGWLESETLLWWGKGVAGVPLVLGGNDPTSTPTNVLAGGQDNRLGTDLLVGMRLNVGKWLDCEKTLGVGARGWGILTEGSTQNYTNGGNSTGVPYFNTSFGVPAIYNVNEAQPNQGANTGTISVATDLDLIAGELYLRTLLAQEGNSRVDLLTGYTFVRLDNSLGLNTEVVDGLTGNIIQNGTITRTQDTFGTKNQFHGGHLGLMHELTRGRFTFSALGKVALGNMQTTTDVNGQFSITNNPAPAAGPRGLFAQSSNSGVITRNQFTFLPEAGAKIKYKIGQAEFGVGYSLLLFPSVAMAADQIDPNIDFSGVVNNVPIQSPAPRFTTDTFFLHGLDLGVTFKF